MLKKGFLVTIIFIVSTAVQLVSQIVVTRLFGASRVLDTFLAAVALPTLVVTVIYATLNDAFLPQYGEKKAQEPDSADRFFSSHVLLLTMVSLLVTPILIGTSPFITRLLYASTNTSFLSAVSTQMSYLFLAIPLAVIATLFGSYFYAHKRFIRFPLAQAIGSIANVILILLIAPYLGTWALICAFVVSIFIQILLVIPKVRWSFSVDFIHLKTISLAWVPLIIANFAVRSDTLLIRSFGSHLGPGYLVYLNLISKILSLAAGMTTIGIQVMLLPHLIEYISNHEYEKTVLAVNKAKTASMILSGITAIGIMLISPPVIHALFVGGKFTTHDADVTISLMPMFLIPAIGWGSVSVFFQPLLAMKKNIHLAVISCVALAAAWTAASASMHLLNPFISITVGLTVLFAVALAGSELVWQISKKQIQASVS